MAPVRGLVHQNLVARLSGHVQQGDGDNEDASRHFYFLHCLPDAPCPVPDDLSRGAWL